MLNTTPLHPKFLISGQTVALRNQFFPLIGLLLIASAFCVRWNIGTLETFGSAGFLIAYWAMLALIIVTVAAFGMWMGLREKSPNAAFFKTILFAVILPLFLSCFWVIVPVLYIVLFLVAVTRLSGRDLQRLVSGEQRAVEMTPVAPIVPAPPVIKP